MGQILEIIGVIFYMTFLFVALWSIYLFPAALSSFPFWLLGARRAKWTRLDYSVLLFPFLVWVAVLFANYPEHRNFLNTFWIGCGVPVVAMIRVIVGQRVNRYRLAGVLITLYSFVPILMWLLRIEIP